MVLKETFQQKINQNHYAQNGTQKGPFSSEYKKPLNEFYSPLTNSLGFNGKLLMREN